MVVREKNIILSGIRELRRVDASAYGRAESGQNYNGYNLWYSFSFVVYK